MNGTLNIWIWGVNDPLRDFSVLSCPCVDVRLVWVHVTLVFMLLQKSVCFLLSNKARNSFYLSLEQDDMTRLIAQPERQIKGFSHFWLYACICREIWPRRKSTQLCGEWMWPFTENCFNLKGPELKPSSCSPQVAVQRRPSTWADIFCGFCSLCSDRGCYSNILHALPEGKIQTLGYDCRYSSW